MIGVLYGVLRGAPDLKGMGALASRVAAVVVGQQGTRLRVNDAARLAESFEWDLARSRLGSDQKSSLWFSWVLFRVCFLIGTKRKEKVFFFICYSSNWKETKMLRKWIDGFPPFASIHLPQFNLGSKMNIFFLTSVPLLSIHRHGVITPIEDHILSICQRIGSNCFSFIIFFYCFLN